MNNMKIRNKNLALYLDFKLNKIGDEFTVSELEELKEFSLNQLNDFGEYEEVDLEILDYVPNVETLVLRNFKITDELLEKIKNIKNLKSISFERCSIDDFNKIGNLNVEFLSITGNPDLRTDFLKDSKKYKGLVLNDSDLIDIANLKDMSDLEFLHVSHSNIDNPEMIKNFNGLKSLYINDTDIDDISFLENMENLLTVGIDRDLYMFSGPVTNKLESKGTMFFDNGYIPLTIVREKEK